MQNTSCTNFATEKVSVTRFAWKNHKRRSRYMNNLVTGTKKKGCLSVPTLHVVRHGHWTTNNTVTEYRINGFYAENMDKG